ncbi:MAG TPA: hypothetical protein DEF43_03600 [Chloroflexus aurantiacus]|jgi:hypothetical protein|uniref:hypothetical protein n=1 Tax=Chloroflexus sp. TaxID=1904827 RepID=UPI000173B1D7|nr:MAG: hypothetical protein D6716_10415 [Chloroflexota bacterium]HBW66245.1 hypothetical protein [Chloroflexus aurantiacus]
MMTGVLSSRKLGARASGAHGAGTIPLHASHAHAHHMEGSSHPAAPTALIAPPLRNRLACQALVAGRALQPPLCITHNSDTASLAYRSGSGEMVQAFPGPQRAMHYP